MYKQKNGFNRVFMTILTFILWNIRNKLSNKKFSHINFHNFGGIYWSISQELTGVRLTIDNEMFLFKCVMYNAIAFPWVVCTCQTC